MKKTIFNIFIIALSVIIFVLLVHCTDGFDDLVHQLNNMNKYWISLAFVCMLFYWLFEAMILHIITKILYNKQRFRDSLKTTIVGQFFNAITPFASGGQPAQLYMMSKDGIEAGKAASILMFKFIIYQFVLTIYSLVIILFKSSFFLTKLNHFFVLILLGFVVNTGVITCLIVFSRNHTLLHKFLMFVSKVLKFFKITKDMDALEHKIEAQLDHFQESAHIIKTHFRLMIRSSLLTILQLTVFFSIPYLIYRSFGMSNASYTNMLAAKSFVMMLTSFIPLPGAAGGAEGGFYMFFGLFFKPQNIMSGILMWRIITYHTCILFGGLTVVFAPEKPLKSRTSFES